MANGDILKLGPRGAGVNARFWCNAPTPFAGLFFEVTTEKTDKSQAVGERGIPPLKERRVGHPASIPNGWFSKEKFTNGAGAPSRSVSWRGAHPGPGTQVGSIVADGQLEVCDGAYRIFVMKEKSKAPPFASR